MALPDYSCREGSVMNYSANFKIALILFPLFDLKHILLTPYQPIHGSNTNAEDDSYYVKSAHT
jgi:hypothetical protein